MYFIYKYVLIELLHVIPGDWNGNHTALYYAKCYGFKSHSQ